MDESGKVTLTVGKIQFSSLPAGTKVWEGTRIPRTEPFPAKMTAQPKYDLYRADPLLDTHEHLPYLRAVARGNVMEIGVWSGISTAALLTGVEEKGGHLWSVDVNAAFRYVWHGHPNWTFLHSDSKNLNLLLPQVGLPLEVLFVDGDHSYEGCLADLRNWGSQVKPGGLILVHDADTPAFPGVRQAIDEYCGLRGLEHELRRGSNGLEIIRA